MTRPLKDGPPQRFASLWYDLHATRSTVHRHYDELDHDEQMAAWMISAAIANRIPLEHQARLCLDGMWLRIVEKSKPAIRSMVGIDYREEAWFAGCALALEDLAIHCNHHFPGVAFDAAAA